MILEGLDKIFEASDQIITFKITGFDNGEPIGYINIFNVIKLRFDCNSKLQTIIQNWEVVLKNSLHLKEDGFELYSMAEADSGMRVPCAIEHMGRGVDLHVVDLASPL